MQANFRCFPHSDEIALDFSAERHYVIGMILLFLMLLPAVTLAQVTAQDLSWAFECGSLQSATTVQPNELNLTLRLDDAWGDLYGWYDFKILQHAAGQTVTFHILNPDGWMNEAHQPVYSQDGGLNWLRVEDTWMASGDFHFRQVFSADSAEISLAFPYSYSRLLSDLSQLAESPFCDYEFIGCSVQGRQIPLATITDPFVPDAEKRVAWLMARQHPMEAPASFLLQGLMEFLTDPIHPLAERLRRTTIYKITPMVNVDGVAEGYSRHNVNGVNLNRCWAYDSLYVGEQPEVNVAHRAMDEWIYASHSLDFFNDFHCAPDLYDFGYELSAIYSFPAHYQDETSFTKHLDERDLYQNWTLWRDLDSSYGSGLVTMALYNQHAAIGLSSENSWSRRGAGQYITIPSLLSEGIMYALAIDDYLHPVHITDAMGGVVDQLEPGDPLYLRVKDPDENDSPNWIDTVQVAVFSETNADTESYSLSETGIATGVFFSSAGHPIGVAAASPGDGILQVAAWDRIFAVYVDDDFERDSSWAIANFATMGVALHPRHGQFISLGPQIDPNPFNAATVIRFQLPSAAFVTLEVFDLTGRRVGMGADAPLPWTDGWQEAGMHEVAFDGSELASGVYICRFAAGKSVSCGKMILLK